VRLHVCSLEDQASVNIGESLQELGRWQEVAMFEGHPVLGAGSLLLATIDTMHLKADAIDRRFTESTDITPDEVVFLSRHRAASGKPSLTVHPIGNYGAADYGGRPGELVPAAPELMTDLLRRLKEEAKGLQYEVTFEATHHGPYLETPTLFIEIGSDETTWGDREAGEAIASSLFKVEPSVAPRAIGVGGGHYAPRFTEIAMSKRISFGHMLPNYAMDLGDPAALERRIQIAMDRSNTNRAYVHQRSMKRSEATMVSALIEKMGGEVIGSSDLLDL
jgi:D-aminoacyl-tRNA deacylase